ncbi:MAG: hypothetical protein Q8L22_21205, partial [Reyranella sp.]|nr:hypothetical protein [Reyranella sp.]
LGSFGFVAGVVSGIHLAARDIPGNDALLKALYASLTSFGHPVDADKSSVGISILKYPGAPDVSGAAAAIFIGAKPVPATKK